MSKVALRLYNREIETLIDQGHVEEAVAHCQHILKSFPKHIETYRLLGKAYLEAHRYNDAVDIFQRVLLAVPDDFISHLGMSVIRDEQKDIDGAIWHMERAFEINPSNAGVQNELRRLYGRRDGLEPPKIRLTRGALAHMYSKGGQYAQAIAEIKSVLAEDSSRVDLKLLLARTYYLAGQKVEATEVCTELLGQYPFTLDANRILVQVLPGTSLAASVETYRKRVQGLDPYAALATQNIFDVANVQEHAITVDRLDYDPNQQPAWSAESQASSSAGDGAIPDWMKTSGWGESTGEFQDGPMSFDDDTPAAPSELATAEIPDWLKGMAPPEKTSASTSTGEVAEEDLNWLSGLGAGVAGDDTKSTNSEESATPDWLNEMAGSAGIAPAPVADSGLEPVTSMDSTPSSQAPADFPDWLKGIGEESETSEPAVMPDFSAAVVSDQMSSAQSESEGEAESASPDWMGEMQNGIDENNHSEDASENNGTPDWLGNLASSEDVTDESEAPTLSNLVTGPGTSEADQDDALKWLEGLAAGQGAKPEEMLTQPSERSEAAPDWLNQMDEPSQSAVQPEMEISSFMEETPAAEELSALVTGPGTSEADQDDAMKWLESLAANQGAKPEELLTQPSDRNEQAPDWLNQMGQAAQPAEAETEMPSFMEETSATEELSALVTGPGTSEADQDDAMKWLESLAANQGASPEELITSPTERSADMPDWLENISSESQPVEPAVSAPESKEDDVDWLANLSGEVVPSQFDESTAVESDGGQPAAAVVSDEDSNWLDDLVAGNQSENSEPASSEETLPSWMSGLSDENAESDNSASNSEVVSPEQHNMKDGDDTEEDDWLKNLSGVSAEGNSQSDSSNDVPEWLASAEVQDEVAETNQAPVDTWLAELSKSDDSSEMDTAAVETESTGGDSMPVQAEQTDDLSQWLSQLDDSNVNQPADNETAEVLNPEEIAAPSSEMPSWINELGPETSGPDDDIPAWLRQAENDAAAPVEVQDVAAGWVPAAEAPVETPVEESKPEFNQPVAKEEPKPDVQERLRSASILDDKDGPALQQARELLESGDLENAMAEYARLIKKGRLLEESIYDLQEATYQHPVDVVVWQTLGDAFMRVNRLQEALDAYTKAEELLR